MGDFERNPRLAGTMKQALADGANAVVLEFQRRIRQKLSTRGTGAIYGLRVGGLGQEGYFRKNTIRTAGRLGLSLDRFGRIINVDGQRRVLRYINNGNKRRTLRSLGLHRASAPGQPPAVNTGRLRQSWIAGADHRRFSIGDATGYTLRLGTNLRYAVFLEDGTRRMMARPYFEPVMDEMHGVADAIFAVAFRRRMRSLGMQP